MLKFQKLRPPINVSGGAFQVVMNPAEQGDYVLLSAVSFYLQTDATVIDRSVLLAFSAVSEFLLGPVYTRKSWVAHQASRNVVYQYSLGVTPRTFNPAAVVFAPGDDYWSDDLPRIVIQNSGLLNVTVQQLQAGDTLSRLEVQYWSGKPNDFGPIL